MTTLSAVLVTRGDVDLAPIIERFEPSLFDDVIVWNNDPFCNHASELAARAEAAARVPLHWANVAHIDLAVYGRYAALRAAPAGAVVYVQDDDCVLPPASLAALAEAYQPGWLITNMPEPFHAHYTFGDSCLVGFGAVFDAHLPAEAFDRFLPAVQGAAALDPDGQGFSAGFLRCCDVVFTALTPMSWVDVAYENLPYATGADRMYRQPAHVGERAEMLALARGVRDAS